MNTTKTDRRINKENDLEKTIIIAVIMIIVTILVGFIIKSILNGDIKLPISNYLTYKNYMEIEDGMSYAEVVTILGGHKGILMQSADFSASDDAINVTTYVWQNRSRTKSIAVGFINGKVCAKAQLGLG